MSETVFDVEFADKKNCSFSFFIFSKLDREKIQPIARYGQTSRTHLLQLIRSRIHFLASILHYMYVNISTFWWLVVTLAAHTYHIRSPVLLQPAIVASDNCVVDRWRASASAVLCRAVLLRLMGFQRVEDLSFSGHDMGPTSACHRRSTSRKRPATWRISPSGPRCRGGAAGNDGRGATIGQSGRGATIAASADQLRPARHFEATGHRPRHLLLQLGAIQLRSS